MLGKGLQSLIPPQPQDDNLSETDTPRAPEPQKNPFLGEAQPYAPPAPQTAPAPPPAPAPAPPSPSAAVPPEPFEKEDEVDIPQQPSQHPPTRTPAQPIPEPTKEYPETTPDPLPPQPDEAPTPPGQRPSPNVEPEAPHDVPKEGNREGAADAWNPFADTPGSATPPAPQTAPAPPPAPAPAPPSPSAAVPPEPFEKEDEVDIPQQPSQHPPTRTPAQPIPEPTKEYPETTPDPLPPQPDEAPTPPGQRPSPNVEPEAPSEAPADPETPQNASQATPQGRSHEQIKEPVFHIETGRIRSNPYQPRKIYDEEELNDLANSIREYGILQPLVVTRIEKPTPEGGVNTEYELIAGERRLLASRKVGLERVPAIIRDEPRDQREKLEMALIENIQRSNLNPLDTARAYAKLQDDFGLSQREIGQRLGKSRAAVANSLRLLQLPRDIQHALRDGVINESHARLLLQADHPETQRQILSQIQEHSLSVRKTQELVDQTKIEDGTMSTPRKGSTPDPHLEMIRKRLEEKLGTRVKVTRRGQKGKITIKFFSEEELSSLLDHLDAQ